ncbi:MAG TPA: ribbon-helix-helix protein, CopG family [Verrucomicrobiae bacterium]|nr:ribbon-helix-helix protein, CopG family [Verrucomicrobiae bacterium]
MTLSIRLTAKEARALEALAKRTGRSKSEIVRDALQRVRSTQTDARRETALALAGSLSGPRDLSRREGFGPR